MPPDPPRRASCLWCLQYAARHRFQWFFSLLCSHAWSWGRCAEQIKFEYMYHDSNSLPVALGMGCPLRSPQMWASGRCNSAKISSCCCYWSIEICICSLLFAWSEEIVASQLLLRVQGRLIFFTIVWVLAASIESLYGSILITCRQMRFFLLPYLVTPPICPPLWLEHVSSLNQTAL